MFCSLTPMLMKRSLMRACTGSRGMKPRSPVSTRARGVDEAQASSHAQNSLRIAVGLRERLFVLGVGHGEVVPLHLAGHERHAVTFGGRGDDAAGLALLARRGERRVER